MSKIKAIAVIGANYGDEGKGATTHTVACRYGAAVVARFNGGPQAGHTVQLADGKKHVFSSLTSGSFFGSTNYISEHCLVNPVALQAERKAFIQTSSKTPMIFIHPDAYLITPWDIALNQFLEHGKGDAKHGSCGMGIGETMHRTLTIRAPKFQVKNYLDQSFLFTFCADMRSWFIKRCKEEAEKGHFSYLNGSQKEALDGLMRYPTSLTTKMYEFALSLQNCVLSPVYRNLKEDDTVVFEGAQGLLLDEDDPDHQPHVTWSKTGITNVVKECAKYDLDLVKIYYVTRPYLTRHGNGPILAGIETENVWGSDLTNKPNDYQGTLRYAHLDWGKLQRRIVADMELAKPFQPEVRIALTCYDQVHGEERFKFLRDGHNHDIPPDALLDEIESATKMQVAQVAGSQCPIKTK